MQPKQSTQTPGAQQQGSTSVSISARVVLVSSILFCEEEGRQSAAPDDQLVRDLRAMVSEVQAQASALGHHVEYADTLKTALSDNKLDTYYRYVNEASIVLLLFTKALLASASAREMVETAMAIQYDRKSKAKQLCIIPVIGQACEWLEAFPRLSPNLNGATAPIDGRPLSGRQDKQQQLQKFSRDIASLLFNGG